MFFNTVHFEEQLTAFRKFQAKEEGCMSSVLFLSNSFQYKATALSVASELIETYKINSIVFKLI